MVYQICRKTYFFTLIYTQTIWQSLPYFTPDSLSVSNVLKFILNNLQRIR